MKTPCPHDAHRGPGRLARCGLLASAALLLAACASTPPPIETLAVANAAVGRAASAGGAEAAPVEMQSARQKLDRAKLAMAAEEYDQARTLSEQAQVDAQLAETKARSSQAVRSANELQEGIRVLREELDRKNR